MSILLLLFIALLNDASCSYMGTENSLRRNIMDLFQGKLKFSDATLPFEKDELSDKTPKNQSEYDFIVIGVGSSGAIIASRLSEIQNVTVLLYSKWAVETGDDSWSYRNMLKFFKKLESFRLKDVKFDQRLHNKNGPVRITSVSDRHLLTDAFIAAGRELGYPEIDFNGIEQRGFSYLQSTIFEGERWSSNRAYLRPAKGRQNLIVTQHSHVLKILIDEETKNAYGVRYSKNGKIYEVGARKEIILSAGAINSPQILMLSGVGLAKHLQDMKINVIKDAPVDENLKDHIAYGGLIFKVNDSDTFDATNFLDPKNSAIKDYITSKTGPLTHGVSQGAISFMNVDDSLNENPIVELLFAAKPGLKDPILSSLMGINENFKNQMLNDKFNHSAWTVWPILLRPRSSGQILLRSINPFDKPMIYPNYLQDPEDIRILIKGIRATMNLSKSRALKKFGSELYQIPIPPSCKNQKNDSDEYWECLLRTYTVTVYHYAGTCKMGREDSKKSVVNSELKVIGIKNLRVADTSIMPNIISGHTNIPAIAIRSVHKTAAIPVVVFGTSGSLIA